jgi:putative salt-induced outer membrane protein YdiY
MNRPLTLIPTIILYAILAAPASAAADELRLMNGDRLTGRVVSLAGGTLTFSTPNGDLKIPWSSVTALTVDDTILATIGPAAPAPITGAVVIATTTALTRPQPAWIIDGGANAGFVSSAGNTDVNNLRLDGDIVARADRNRYTALAAVTRAEDGDVETVRNWSAGFKYDRFVSSRAFVNANAIFTNDRFRDLDLRTALGAGFGYQVLQTALVTLTTDAGLGWVNEDLEDPQPDDSYTAVRESAALIVHAVPDRVQFFHQHDGYFGITGDDNLFIKMQNGVRVGLAAGFVTTLRLDVDYDRSPAPGRKNMDKTFAFTLGYRF